MAENLHSERPFTTNLGSVFTMKTKFNDENTQGKRRDKSNSPQKKRGIKSPRKQSPEKTQKRPPLSPKKLSSLNILSDEEEEDLTPEKDRTSTRQLGERIDHAFEVLALKEEKDKLKYELFEVNLKLSEREDEKSKEITRLSKECSELKSKNPDMLLIDLELAKEELDKQADLQRFVEKELEIYVGILEPQLKEANENLTEAKAEYERRYKELMKMKAEGEMTLQALIQEQQRTLTEQTDQINNLKNSITTSENQREALLTENSSLKCAQNNSSSLDALEKQIHIEREIFTKRTDEQSEIIENLRKQNEIYRQSQLDLETVVREEKERVKRREMRIVSEQIRLKQSESRYIMLEGAYEELKRRKDR